MQNIVQLIYYLLFCLSLKHWQVQTFQIGSTFSFLFEVVSNQPFGFRSAFLFYEEFGILIIDVLKISSKFLEKGFQVEGGFEVVFLLFVEDAHVKQENMLIIIGCRTQIFQHQNGIGKIVPFDQLLVCSKDDWNREVLILFQNETIDWIL